MIDFTLTIKSIAPLLMHNIRLADPLDGAAKNVADAVARHKKSKTEADMIETRHQEFLGGLYYDDAVGVYLPTENILQSLVDGAKSLRLGKVVAKAILFLDPQAAFAYAGPRDPEELWTDENFRHTVAVRVQSSRPMRTRPMFKKWASEVDGILDETLLDWDQLVRVVGLAGSAGIGDWRPKYGRYTATVERKATR